MGWAHEPTISVAAATDLNQPFLLPPSLQEWLPQGHWLRCVADVVDTLDLSAIYACYWRGQAGYHPVLMVRLLIYGYCLGVVSSRRMERATYEDVAFRYLVADQHPDHDTIWRGWLNSESGYRTSSTMSSAWRRCQ